MISLELATLKAKISSKAETLPNSKLGIAVVFKTKVTLIQYSYSHFLKYFFHYYFEKAIIKRQQMYSETLINR